MATKITDSEMTSDQTRHTAAAVSGSRYGSWTVTWLPGTCLSYNQAITAMTIAEEQARPEPDRQLLASLKTELPR